MKNILLNEIKTVLACTLRFSDRSVCWKKSEDEKQCSSCIQSGPEKTYEHILATAMMVLSALYVYICMCARAGHIQVVAHSKKNPQKQNNAIFLKPHPDFLSSLLPRLNNYAFVVEPEPSLRSLLKRH